MSRKVVLLPLAPGQEPTEFDRTLAQAFGTGVTVATVTEFADGETSIALEEPSALANAVVIFLSRFSFGGGCTINKQLLDTLYLVDVVKQFGASRVVLLSPYLPYSRQCESDLGAQQGFAGVLVRLAAQAGIDEIIACDVHDPALEQLSPVPLHSIEMTDFWYEFLHDMVGEGDGFVLASPDRGGIIRVEALADELGVDSVYVEKKRVAPDTTKSMKLHGEVKGRVVIVLDDILSTGSTALSACEMLLSEGASGVVGCFTHAIFSGDALAKIEASQFRKVFVTNSVRSVESITSDKVVVLPIDTFLYE